MEASSEVVIALIGTVGGLVTLLLQHHLQNRKPATVPPRRRRTVLLWAPVHLLGGLAVGITVGRLIERDRQADAVHALAPEVRILVPATGALVQMEEMIRGASARVPAGDSVWVVIYIPTVARYYPQDNPADVQAGGGWNSLARLGVDGDRGRAFDLLAVSANASAREAFRTYHEHSRRTGRWEGLDRLPAGAREFHRVNVQRQP